MSLRRRKPLRTKTPLRSRTRLKRRTPLRSTSTLDRTGRLNPISPKRRREQVRRRSLRQQLADVHGPGCQIRSPVCTGRHQGLHHLLKAGQGGQTTARNCVLACNPCNGYVEDHPRWGRDNGWVVRSWEAGL